MADRTKSSSRNRWITILVVVVVALGAWWVFDRWSQPPAVMPATGEPPVQNPAEGEPMMRGNPPQGNDLQQQ